MAITSSKRGTLPPFNVLSYSNKQGTNKRKDGTPSFQRHTKFKLYQKFEGNIPANSTPKDMSLTSRSVTPHALRTTSHVSFPLHKATFATSQSCRKKAIVSPDPCSPMTNNASLPTLFSHELLDDAEEPFSDRPAFLLNHQVQTVQSTRFHCFDWDAGRKPNQLTEAPELFVQQEEELAMRPIPPWDVPPRRSCA